MSGGRWVVAFITMAAVAHAEEAKQVVRGLRAARGDPARPMGDRSYLCSQRARPVLRPGLFAPPATGSFSWSSGDGRPRGRWPRSRGRGHCPATSARGCSSSGATWDAS